MKKIYPFLLFLIVIGIAGCASEGEETTRTEPVEIADNPEVQEFLDDYTQEYVNLYYTSAKAAWASNTKIVEGDTMAAYEEKVANEAFAEFTGSEENINQSQEMLKRDDISPLQRKQLEAILYMAADNPATVPELVKARIKAETEQTQSLYGFQFQLNGKKVSTNDLDDVLKTSDDPADRQAAWTASKEVGKALKPGLVNLRNLRNQTVQALGYEDFFAYQVSDYDMDSKEMMDQMKQLVADIWPLYRELHTYARYTLAEKYDQPVPDYLPAHWLPNRWGQDWSSMVQVEGLDLDGALEEKGPEWLVKTAEDFYVSVGFERLPESFYEKSSLYPVPEGADYQKNNHASAWHLDLDHDVRSLMSVIPNTEWYETTHHELGHIYYYLTYTNPDVPPLLREGANRGYHEAMGSLLGLASLQQPYLESLGLYPKDVHVDEQQVLLKEALNYIVFLPFGAGVMTEFEHDLYCGNLSESEFNQRWWELKKKYQGIEAPEERSEEYCDAASKTHINNDPAQYYDYAMSYVLLFQFHDHIATQILKQNPRATNYAGNEEVGKFLKSIMRPGGTGDWRELLEETVGSGLSATPMLNYFDGLDEYLKELNAGREHTLPETFPG